MFYDLNQEGECSKRFIWGFTFYVGKVSEQELDDMVSKLRKDDIFGSLEKQIPILLNKWNSRNICSQFAQLTKEEKFQIISLIINQYEDYKWVSIL